MHLFLHLNFSQYAIFSDSILNELIPTHSASVKHKRIWYRATNEAESWKAGRVGVEVRFTIS